MEHYKIFKLLNYSTVQSWWQKWIEVNDLSGGQYSANNYIWFETPVLRSDLCDYRDVYVVVSEGITVTDTDNANRRNQKLTFENDALFRPCILKISNTFMRNEEHLDIVMLLVNLIEYSDNYCMTSGSLWNYYRDEVNNDANENNAAANYRINSNRV